jgi:hypothetical protein
VSIVTHWQMPLPKIHKFICQSLLTTLAPRQCQHGIQPFAVIRIKRVRIIVIGHGDMPGAILCSGSSIHYYFPAPQFINITPARWATAIRVVDAGLATSCIAGACTSKRHFTCWLCLFPAASDTSNSRGGPPTIRYCRDAKYISEASYSIVGALRLTAPSTHAQKSEEVKPA